MLPPIGGSLAGREHLQHGLRQRFDAPVDVGRGEVVVEPALDQRDPRQQRRVGELPLLYERVETRPAASARYFKPRR
jgi:hypothetical protein